MRTAFQRRNVARGLTLLEVVALIVVALIAVYVVLNVIARRNSRIYTYRAICASNLRGIGQGMKVYSNDNQDWYPTPSFAGVDANEPTDTSGAHQVSFIGELGRNCEQALPPDTERMHPSRALYMLVIEGFCIPKQFICPYGGDTEDVLRNFGAGGERACRPGFDRFDFRGYDNLSYGVQLPFGPQARPSENLDPRVALVADKGPFFQAGPHDAQARHTPDAPRGTPGTALSSPDPKVSDPNSLLRLANDLWKPYNSFNHKQEGQNVLFGDGHVDFVKKPIVGVNYDNIYTAQSGFTMMDTLLGNTPADRRGPLTNTDSVIVP
jgi:prepilin-type processing-associated H-X9-DG protein